MWSVIMLDKALGMLPRPRSISNSSISNTQETGGNGGSNKILGNLFTTSHNIGSGL
jgi:hypothetical protein